MSLKIAIRASAFVLASFLFCMPVTAFQSWGHEKSWEDARKSNSVEQYSEWLDATVEDVAQFHDHFHPARGRGVPAETQVVAYKELASKMKVPKEVELIEFPEAENSDNPWVENAKKAASAIKPQMNYHVDNISGFKVIQGTTEAEKNLKDNVKVIAWYRDQIEKVCPDKVESEGSYALAQLIDEFLLELADSVPPVRVKLKGPTNSPDDKKLEYSDKKLWEMISTVNRYFYYKIQIHEDKKEALPADYLLVGSMVKTAALYGAAPPRKSLVEIETQLAGTEHGWKRAGYDAIKSWEKEINGQTQKPQKVCVIEMPETPPVNPPKEKQKADPDEFPPDVEDVKELGGKIFIKRDGYWKLWKGGDK
jgi:hypothetical protein